MSNFGFVLCYRLTSNPFCSFPDLSMTDIGLGPISDGFSIVERLGNVIDFNRMSLIESSLIRTKQKYIIKVKDRKYTLLIHRCFCKCANLGI